MHKSKSKQRNVNNDITLSPVTLLKSYVLFCFIFFVFAIIFSILLSLFFFRTENPTSKIRLISLVSIYFSSFICGILIARKAKEKLIVLSLVLGFILFSLLFTASLFIRNSENSIYFHLLIPIFTVIGALIGRKREKKICLYYGKK